MWESGAGKTQDVKIIWTWRGEARRDKAWRDWARQGFFKKT